MVVSSRVWYDLRMARSYRSVRSADHLRETAKGFVDAGMIELWISRWATTLSVRR
jgi:hypothetical protein